VAATLGLLAFLAGTVGVLRFPDPLSRLHAIAKADTLGVGLVVLALVPQVDGPLDGAKLVLVWMLAMVSAATSGPLTARLAASRGGAT